ncbi:unnamed protein product, partial [marine sediment metagenome]
MALNFLNNGYFAGKVGIGTEGAVYQLTLGGNAVGSTEGLRINDPSNAAYGAHFSFSDTPNEVWIGGITNNTYNSAIGIYREATRSITIDASNEVGIGTVSPGYKLDVVGSIKASVQGRFASGSASTPSYSFDADSDSGMFRATTNALGFSTAATERMRITSAGNVGIGTTSPSYKLDVSDEIRMVGGLNMTAQTGTLYATDGALSYYSSTNGVYLNGAGANGWLRLNASGVQNDQNSINIYGSAGNYMNFRTANVTRLTINASGNAIFTGNVGIGTTSPQAKLQINDGNLYFKN